MQVLVRVVYAGVNPVETYIREGQYSRLPDLPYIPGSGTAANTFNTRSIYSVLVY
jgi:NADPH2:quinone reductase